MKTTILSLFACALSIQFGFALQSENVEGQRFLKQMTHNKPGGLYEYNMEIKSDLDLLLFDWTNSMIEYIYTPVSRDLLALRIAHDTLSGNYIMKIMRLDDSHKVMADVEWSLKEMALPDSIPADKMMTLYEFSALTAERCYKNRRSADNIMKDILCRMVPYRKEIPPISAATPPDSMISFADFGDVVDYRNLRKTFGMFVHQYRPVPVSIVVSEKFALKLHDKMSKLIRDFKIVRGAEPVINLFNGVFIGESVKFRCVVGDEL